MLKFVGCATTMLATAITQLAMAAEPVGGLPIPKFNRGTWSTSVDEEIIGRQTKHYSERLTESCYDPADSVRNSLVSAVNDGCTVKLMSRTETGTAYSTTCTVGTGRSEDLSFIVETKNPAEFKMILKSNHLYRVTTGRWVKECPSAGSLPVPSLKKGVWAINSEQERKGQPPLISESVIALCDEPNTIIRDVLMAAQEKAGCSVTLLGQSQFGVSYGGRCQRPGSDQAKTDWGMVVDSTRPDDFRMTEILTMGTKVTTGQWLRECPANNSTDPSVLDRHK